MTAPPSFLAGQRRPRLPLSACPSVSWPSSVARQLWWKYNGAEIQIMWVTKWATAPQHFFPQRRKDGALISGGVKKQWGSLRRCPTHSVTDSLLLLTFLFFFFHAFILFSLSVSLPLTGFRHIQPSIVSTLLISYLRAARPALLHRSCWAVAQVLKVTN